MNEEPSVLAADSERSTVLARARCCRDWPVSTIHLLGRCGYCGQRPVIIGPWED